MPSAASASASAGAAAASATAGAAGERCLPALSLFMSSACDLNLRSSAAVQVGMPAARIGRPLLDEKGVATRL